MTNRNSKNISFRALIGAIIVSAFITSIAGLLPFGLAYALPAGVLRNITFVISGIATIGFFLWFTRHAYWKELDLMEENTK